MNILIYADNLLPYRNYLRAKIEQIADGDHACFCHEICRLKDCLSRIDNKIKVLILCIKDVHELDCFLAMQSLFDHLFIILILPYSDDRVIAKGHMLKPRYLTSADAAFDDIFDVLNHLKSLAKN